MFAKFPFVIVLLCFYVLALAELQHTANTSKIPEMFKSNYFFFLVPIPCVLCLFSLLLLSASWFYMYGSALVNQALHFLLTEQNNNICNKKCIKMKCIPKEKKNGVVFTVNTVSVGSQQEPSVC